MITLVNHNITLVNYKITLVISQITLVNPNITLVNYKCSTGFMLSSGFQNSGPVPVIFGTGRSLL